MQSRLKTSLVLVVGSLIACIGGWFVYRQVTYQRTARYAYELATQLGLQTDDLLLEQRLCRDLAFLDCGTYLHFTTTLSIEQMRERVKQLDAPRVFENPLSGYVFTNYIGAGFSDPILVDGQLLFSLKQKLPVPHTLQWSLQYDDTLFHLINLHETSRVPVVFEYRGKAIHDNIVTVIVTQ